MTPTQTLLTEAIQKAEKDIDLYTGLLKSATERHNCYLLTLKLIEDAQPEHDHQVQKDI